MPSSSPYYIPLSVWLQRLLALCLISFSGYSSAGIAEFNAAAQTGDYLAAARETASAWESYDKSRDSAVTIAREFAFVNYLADDFESAAGFIAHLTDGGELAGRDDQPLTSQVLADLIALRLESTLESRNALAQSLQARLPEEEVDNISLLAARALYSDDWGRGRLAEIEGSSALAIAFFERAGASSLVEKRRAELMAVAAEFVRWRNVRSYDQFVDLHNAIVADVDSIEDEISRETLIALKWIAHAWTNSAFSYLDSVNPQTGSHIERVRRRELENSSKGFFYAAYTEDSLPICENRLAWNVRYPTSAGFNGLIGTVLIKMDFDSDGRVKNHELLASVPVDSFGASVIDTISRARLRPSRGQDTDNCTLAVNDYIVTINFVIY